MRVAGTPRVAGGRDVAAGMVNFEQVLPFLLLLLILGIGITLIVLISQAQRQRQEDGEAAANEDPTEETLQENVRAPRAGAPRVGGSRLRRRVQNRAEHAERRIEEGSEIDEPEAQLSEQSGSKIKKKKEAHKEQKRAEQEARRAFLEQKKLEEENYWEEQALRKEEEKEAALLAAEEERAAQEEKEKKEQEEYDQWKDLISVENEGDEDAVIEAESEGLLAEFIEYIKKHKVVVLEELAAEFKLRTEEAVNRVEALESMGSISGVFDDRGKFIYVSIDELRAIADFIKKRGRVSISDLAAEASKIVLQPASGSVVAR